MAKQVVFYIKYSKKNGETRLLCDEGTNKPQVYEDLEEARAVASEAKKILVRQKSKSPAAIEKVWIFQTTRNV